MLLSNTDSRVGHAKSNDILVWTFTNQRHRHHDLPGVGELYGIAGQIHQHADQFVFITEHGKTDGGVELHIQTDVFAGGDRFKGGLDMTDHGFELEWRLSSHTRTGLKLRKIQKLLDFIVKRSRQLQDSGGPGKD